MADEARPSGGGRLITLAAWVVLLFGLWLWGKDVTDDDFTVPVLGDFGGVGEPAEGTLPDALEPLSGGAAPTSIAIDELGVSAEIVAKGLDEDGAVEAPPLSEGHTVAWYGDGPTPGVAGVSLLVGHVDTDTDRAVFYNLSSAEPGSEVQVARQDGTVVEFTVENVEVLQRDGFDPDRAYGPRADGRAELRLITCGGDFDQDEGTYTANVVVSAYLTGLDH